MIAAWYNIYSKESKPVHSKDTCSHMSAGALFTIHKTQNQPKDISTDNKMHWEFYSYIKKIK